MSGRVPVVGRGDELAAVVAFFEGEKPPRALLLEGEAGIGKTTLWAEAVAAARRAGFRVLGCRPSGAETQLSYAALADLLEDVLEEVLPGLPRPQRRALEAALLLREPGAGKLDRRAVAAAWLNAVRSLESGGPLAVAIDDLHWLDRETARALEFAARRVEERRVAFVLARRAEPAEPAPLGLERALGPERIERLWVGPLSLGAIHHLLQTRLDVFLPRPTLRRVHELSGGNPFYALELARALRGGTLTLVPGEPLPSTLQELVSDRIARLPKNTRMELAAAAALARPRVADTDLEALQPALDAHVIEVAGDEVRFTHPLLRTAAYTQLPAAKRRQLHGRLAQTVQDVEERARHLALAAEGPDKKAAAELDVAARAVAARGAPEAAAELSERARALTPRDDLLQASQRAIDSGWYYFVAGDTERARRLLEDAVACSPEGPPRARALARLAWLWHHALDRNQAVPLYEAALAEAADDRELQTMIHQGLAWSLALKRGDMEQVSRHAARAVEGYERLEDPSGLADALSVQAEAEFFRGGGLPNRAMDRALEIGSRTGELRVLNLPTMHWALMLLCADRLAEAHSCFSEMFKRAVAQGDESALPFVLMRLSHVALFSGDWPAAAEHAERAYELALQSGQRPLQADLLCTRALVRAHLGDEEEARAACEEGLALAREIGAGIGARLAPWALGLLELSLGDAEGALRRLEPLWRESREDGIVEPGENRYAGDLVEALVTLGRLDEARGVLGEVERLGRALDRPVVLAVGERCRALLAAAEGDLEEAVERAGRACRAHAGLPFPFEHARSLLAAGEVQRRAKKRRAAREALSEALAAFEELGAALWAEKARAELGRIGGRAPGAGELTPTEQRLAELVAEGCSNKEAAAALFVTPKTVETKLSRIYAKLGIHSRAELIRHLSESKL